MSLNIHLITAGLLFWAGAALATNDIILNGLYHGENLLIQNPLSRTSGGFCIEEIYLNDHLILQNPGISAVELDLSHYQLYEPLTIRITHQDGCEPYLLNPADFVFKKEFAYEMLRADDSSVKWASSGEDSSSVHYVDKSIDGLWTQIGRVQARGGFGGAEYSFEVSHNFGPNMYRLRYASTGGREVTSNPVEFLRISEPISFSPNSVVNTITLSQVAFFEIFDLEMNQITKGEGRIIELTGLSSGQYILVLDGVQHQFYKR